MEPLKPELSLLIKLGSIAVHIEEWLSPRGEWVDREAIVSILNDPEIKAWIGEMTKMALLPVKR